jgi:hypothetical protein
MKKIPSLSCVVLYLAVLASVHGQAPPAPEVSSMQWANASAVAGVKFTLLGDVVADPWRPGGRTGAGPRETLQWSADFAPVAGGGTITADLALNPGQSGAGLLVGDFLEKEAAPSSEQLPPGHSVMESNKMLRAALLRFPVGKTRESQYPVYLVNADPENPIKVTANGVAYDLNYAVPQSFKATAGKHTKIKVEAVGLQKEMGFNLDPSDRGGILAFYRTLNTERTAYVFVNLRSIESIKERVQSDSAAAAQP